MTMDDRVAIVTGGSRGIGRAIVEALAHAGMRVAINYRAKAEEAQRLVRDIKAEGGDACAIQGDIGQPSDVARIVSATIGTFGQIDVLVNNAGVSVTGVKLGDMNVQDWQRILAINLDAPFRLIQAVLPHMRKRRSGVIVNLSSNVTQRLPANYGAYTVSKVGIDAMTRILAKEEGDNGIRVNAVAPGPINTDMLQESLRAMGQARAEAFIRSVPLGRMGEPSEIAAVVKFLVSAEASYLTGQTIYVNGGGPGG